VDGIRDYFSLQPPPGTWVAANITARPREHIVARGETLSGIAVRHGVSLSSLRSANRLRGDVVRVGERLQIPGA
jgi:N-acetylmuramoyl-L-alanine amidase